MMTRRESDSIGTMDVPEKAYYGVQTLRAKNNFKITGRPLHPEFIKNLARIKKAAAYTNMAAHVLDEEKGNAIVKACDEIIAGKLHNQFIVDAIQGGAGTSANMNANEVIANRGNEIAGRKLLHPNDDINMSQSSNDTFPTAMHIAAVTALEDRVLPAVDRLAATFRRLEEANAGIVKSGRTHLQDATPITFSQEISGWRTSLERDRQLLELALPPLKELALGGTAVGTGLNAPKGFDTEVAAAVARLTGKDFVTAPTNSTPSPPRMSLSLPTGP